MQAQCKMSPAVEKPNGVSVLNALNLSPEDLIGN
jgi:hypothetical protein